MKKSDKKSLIYVGLAAVVLFFFVRSKNKTVKSVFDEYFDASEYSALKDYWYDVSKMETANFTSNFYRGYHNLFGMKVPTQRNTLAKGAIPGTDNFAAFYSDGDSVQDLILYLKARQYPKTFSSLRSMVEFMASKSYFVGESVDSYYNKVVAWRNK